MTRLSCVDYIHYNDENFVLLASSQPLPTPKDFDIINTNGGSDCPRGYMRTFHCQHGQLLLKELNLHGDIIKKGIKYRNDGLVSKWNGPNRHKIFCEMPPINGVTPVPQFYTDRYEVYSRGKSRKIEEDRVHLKSYEEINLPMNFSGAILIGFDGGWVNFPMPTNFRKVLEILFVNGQLQEVIDATETVEILKQPRDISRTIAVFGAILGHEDAPIRFRYKYPHLFGEP